MRTFMKISLELFVRNPIFFKQGREGWALDKVSIIKKVFEVFGINSGSCILGEE